LRPRTRPSTPKQRLWRLQLLQALLQVLLILLQLLLLLLQLLLLLVQGVQGLLVLQ